ncbi:MAG: IS1634 family transposase [Oscillospiraceae bacterium]|nr:IS1634 family transposase [Oscillospiraceae bacterium]
MAKSGTGKNMYYVFREDVRIKGTDKKKHLVIERIGRVDELKAKDPDIESKLRLEAKRRTVEKKNKFQPITVTYDNQIVEESKHCLKTLYFGHNHIFKIWSDMKLTNFFNKKANKKNAKFIERCIYGLVMHRLTEPMSVWSTIKDLDTYAGIESIGSDVYYQSFDVLYDMKEEIINYLNGFMKENTSRVGPMAYYDVTTHSFESVRQGELRMFGFSKNHKNNEVQVVMGLLIDNNGIPISFDIFPGNTMDQKTLQTAVEDLKKKYQLSKIVVIADRGLNGKDNLVYLVNEGHDFVIAYTLKKSPIDIQEYALSEDGWCNHVYDANDKSVLTWKEKIIPYKLTAKRELSEEEIKAFPVTRGRRKKYVEVEIETNLHITWSLKRKEKDYADRARVIKGVLDLIENPSKINQSIKRGKNQYMKIDIDTNKIELDIEKIKRHAQFDGYYAIVTNQLNYRTNEVTELYKGLWKIEESFRVMKTDFKASPVYLWKDEHVIGHFVMCYMALSIIRYTQFLYKEKFDETISAEKIMTAWRKAKIAILGNYPNIYLSPMELNEDYFRLQQCLNISPLLKYMKVNEFKKFTNLDIREHPALQSL